MKGIVYLDMLQEFLIPQLDEDDQERRIHFQQDGAPPHYFGEMRKYLNTRFPGRWIGRDKQTDRGRSRKSREIPPGLKTLNSKIFRVIG
jgi:hypothetical protein